MKIETNYNPKPIHDRRFDWEAIDAETYDYDGPIGRGKTEYEAIANLLEQVEDVCDDCGECVDDCDCELWSKHSINSSVRT